MFVLIIICLNLPLLLCGHKVVVITENSQDQSKIHISKKKPHISSYLIKVICVIPYVWERNPLINSDFEFHIVYSELNLTLKNYPYMCSSSELTLTDSISLSFTFSFRSNEKSTWVFPIGVTSERPCRKCWFGNEPCWLNRSQHC